MAETKSETNRISECLIWSANLKHEIFGILTLDFFYLMLRLVFPVIDVLDFASPDVPHCADTLSLANHARIILSWFAALCSFAFDQALLDQLVPRDLPAVEVPNTDTALEEASILGAESRKFAHFLDNRDFKGRILTSFAQCHQHEEASPVVVSFPSHHTVLVKGKP